MRLVRIYVRFYKSFNYDYERKFAASSAADPWESIDDSWYPYVRMEIDPIVTTVVGANEAGKSHLLDAIERLITGKKIERSDFCRYSNFFSVEQGARRSPDFGGQFEVESAADAALLKEHLDLELQPGGRFHLFRPNGRQPLLYLEGQATPLTVNVKQAVLDLTLPGVLKLDSALPLPASIPLHELSSKIERPYGSRRSRSSLFKSFFSTDWDDAAALSRAAPRLFDIASSSPREEAPDRSGRQYALARSLLFDVAKIDPTVFEDLSDGIAEEREGYVNGVIEKINGALAQHLNFPRWWAQDRAFRLRVSPREHELVFTIRDRTLTDYSFGERSNGLKYFLSYYVQLLAHRQPRPGQTEILLMDEPDAFLSSQGQQDLLRILEEFARPEDQTRTAQVVYVTHSPFLINRNAGHRIRVLDKGASDEGTRVVKDVARNHYEPLRSSLGALVAETAFIGGSNLFVEGLADQVLLAGTSSRLLANGRSRLDLLDLNAVTIVPAGSASAIPYLVYLARGRDVVRPPCVALLDSDKAGDDAVKALRRGGARGKQLLPQDFVVQIGTWAKQAEPTVAANVVVRELEDLVHPAVAAAAARKYAHKILEAPNEIIESFQYSQISDALPAHDGSVFDALSSAFAGHFTGHIETVGFAREVIATLHEADVALREQAAQTEENFRSVLGTLASLLRRAKQEEDERRLSNRLKRTVASFLEDYPKATSRERARLILEEVLAAADNTSEGDQIRIQVGALRREFELDENLTDPVPRFDVFRQRLRGLQYQERFANQDKPNEHESLAAAISSATPSGGGKPSADRVDPNATAPLRVPSAKRQGDS